MDEKPSEIGGRDYSQQQNAAPAGVPQNALSRAKSAITSKIPTSTEDLTKLASQKLMGRFAETGTGKAVTSLTEDAQSVAKLVATGGADLKSWWTLIKKHYKLVAIILLIPGIMLIGISAAIGMSLSHIGDPSTSVAAASSGMYGATSDGKYCQQMTPQIPLASGKLLSLEETEGIYSEEDPAAPDSTGLGTLTSGDTGKKLSTALYQRYDGKKGYTADELKYYVTARWLYVAAKFDGSTAHKDGLAGYQQYAGRKIMLYNPKNGKAAIGIVAEYGPAAWTNTGAEYDGDRNRTKDNPEQRQAWENGQPRVQAPANYDGRIAGGPPALTSALGITNKEKIVIGFLDPKLQSMPLGQAQCSVVSAGKGSGANFHVCIDPGHGGSNGGATGNGLDEVQVAWDIGTELKSKLESSGYTVTMTKATANQTVPNPGRAVLCNNANADLAIHIHADAADHSANGYTIFEPEKIKGVMTQKVITSSSAYVDAFHSAYAQSLGRELKDRGIKPDSDTQHGGLDVSNGSLVPTFLIEVFFIDNSHDTDWYKNSGKEKIVNAFLAGIGAAKEKKT